MTSPGNPTVTTAVNDTFNQAANQLDKGGRMTNAQVAAVASKAGFSGDDVRTATAIAFAESGGNPNAHNGNAGTKDDSYGLWQINYYGDLKASRTKAFGPGPGLLDPQKNANAAHQIFKQSGWSAWSTYKSGTYKKFLNQTNTDAAIEGAVNSAGGAINSVDPGAALNSIGSNILKFGNNLSGILIVVVLLALGVVLLARKQISNILPASKALKTVKNIGGGQ